MPRAAVQEGDEALLENGEVARKILGSALGTSRMLLGLREVLLEFEALLPGTFLPRAAIVRLLGLVLAGSLRKA